MKGTAGLQRRGLSDSPPLRVAHSPIRPFAPSPHRPSRATLSNSIRRGLETMPFDDLRQFVRALEKIRELKRISFEVDPDLEITEITDRVSKAGGPALLFEKVKGHSIPVLINALGSRKRMLTALGVADYSEIADRIVEITDVKSPQGLIEKIKMVPRVAEMARMFPKIVKDGPCKEVVLKEGK